MKRRDAVISMLKFGAGTIVLAACKDTNVPNPNPPDPEPKWFTIRLDYERLPDEIHNRCTSVNDCPPDFTVTPGNDLVRTGNEIVRIGVKTDFFQWYGRENIDISNGTYAIQVYDTVRSDGRDGSWNVARRIWATVLQTGVKVELTNIKKDYREGTIGKGVAEVAVFTLTRDGQVLNA